MTDAEKREAARQFYQKWVNRGKEDEDDRSYWIDFLQNVMGVDHVTDRIDFQKKVVGADGNTKRIDAYIPETRVLIEQKSLNIDLSKPQSGHNGMTPYEQAKMYDNSLPVSEKSKWIILSNFAEIWVYDMDTKVPTPQKFLLSDIPSKYRLFDFLVDQKQQKITQEMEVSVKAGELVGLIYDALLKQYKNPDNPDSLKSLNKLCVRLVFCLYAEDAHIFGENGHMFHDYLEQFDTKSMRKGVMELFKILDTKPEDRDPYDDSMLSEFPYVNGGLFSDEDIEIPHFTDEIRNILLSNASDGFDWSMISPTIFGAVFESTLNPETRRSGGMHYTSIENIHKVIDPLFLDDLRKELNEIKEIQIIKSRNMKLKTFQKKLASLSWLDPACGSGNFLTETYISIRRLENEVIKLLKGGQMLILFDEQQGSPIQVSINQFYGIEINDFAVTVAKTALWIAESQMMKETEDILVTTFDFLPLKTNAYIVEGNALHIDWNEVVSKTKLNYIMGNPPFIGSSIMAQGSLQKKDVQSVFSELEKNEVQDLDYVTCWYKKAAEYIQNTKIECSFVSTNSICQGSQTPILWKVLFEEFKITINYAYTTFLWNSESSNQAAVYCVIIGFSIFKRKEKIIYNVDGSYKQVSNISPYLIEGDNTYVIASKNPICNVPKMSFGNQPRDGGYLVIKEDERKEILSKEPNIEKWLHEYIGAEEFIKGKHRWCLWLKEATPQDIKSSKILYSKVESVKEFRITSKAKTTNGYAKVPHLFAQITQPAGVDYLIIPRVSSERRRYIPIGFMNKEVIASDAVQIIPNATLFHFGVLTSNVHMAWMRVVCGRLKSDYRYSKEVVYNTFPWCNPSDEQRKKIEKTAKEILDVRALYSETSLAVLYDPLAMPQDLRKAHSANDRAVMQAYGFSIKDTSEADCVAALMKMYQEMIDN